MKNAKRGGHTPVLVEAILEGLGGGGEAADVAGWMVDATLGAGGHARAILEAFPRVRLFGIDRDPDAVEQARATLAPFGKRALARCARISELDEALRGEGVARIVGILFDLGASSMQLDRPERGFSFQADGPLDMRMGPDVRRTAADIINGWDESDLADLFFHEGGERRSRRIAAAIVEARRRVPFLRTMALGELVARTVGRSASGRIHPATRVFQALRRAVNEEGEELRRGLLLAEAELEPGGRLAVVTFHSGEDGQVKRFLAAGERAERWHLPRRKPIEPSRQEVRANPRARSARLRVARRLNGLGNGGNGA